MTTLEVPNKYLASSPIIVTSPTSRCGTTLVQRLLSASDNGFIYGEQIGNEIKVLTTMFMEQLRFLQDRGEVMDADFERALAGALCDWRPGLSPPAAVMLKAWVDIYYQIPAALTAHARAINRPVWGFKFPGYTRDTLKAILSLMPQARIVYVFRNPFDVLKSAKARKFVNTNKDIATLCAQWATNMGEISELARDERVLLVKYEGLIAQRAEYIRMLEMFTGVQNIDARAFDLKINTFQGDQADGHAPDQYIPPAPLTKADRGYVLNKAGPIVERLYGDQLQAA